MDYPSLNKLFLDAVDRYAQSEAQMYQDRERLGVHFCGRNAAARGGLVESAGRTGNQGGRPRGAVRAELSGVAHRGFRDHGLGAASVPIYFNESPDRLTYILNDSGARIVITAGRSAGAEDRGMRANACRASST